MYNWDYLKRYDNIELIKGGVRDAESIKKAAEGVAVNVASQLLDSSLATFS
jgi:hypothetical protein